MFSKQQTYFSQAVIFIFVHSDTGSAGLILNRPTQYQLGKIAGAEDMCPQFADSTLYLGGDVGKSTLNILHSHGELEGAVEIVNGVYIGGFEAAKEAVVNGTAKAEDFRWFTRHAGWGPGQVGFGWGFFWTVASFQTWRQLLLLLFVLVDVDENKDMETLRCKLKPSFWCHYRSSDWDPAFKGVFMATMSFTPNCVDRPHCGTICPFCKG